MAKSKRPTGSQVRIQVIYSEPRKVLKEKYLTPKGKRLLSSAKTKAQKEVIWAKYGKNRYTINPNAKPIGQINHLV